jgi:hypothetical protein
LESPIYLQMQQHGLTNIKVFVLFCFISITLFMILRKDIFSSSIVIKKLKPCYQEVQALPLESLALSSGSCRPII